MQPSEIVHKLTQCTCAKIDDQLVEILFRNIELQFFVTTNRVVEAMLDQQPIEETYANFVLVFVKLFHSFELMTLDVLKQVPKQKKKLQLFTSMILKFKILNKIYLFIKF